MLEKYFLHARALARNFYLAFGYLDSFDAFIRIELHVRSHSP